MKISLDGTCQQFFEKDELLYRKWVPPQQSSEMEIEQLVLSEKCCQGVLQLVRTTPLAGHLEKDKTMQRILHWFYWSSVYKDVAEYCMPSVCNLPKIITSSCPVSSPDIFASFIRTIHTYCNGHHWTIAPQSLR